jgi:DNA-binding transcriptional MocR family regulator
VRQSNQVQSAQLLALPEPSALPLQGRVHQAVVQAVVQAILDGRLTAAAPMPSSRELARLSNLSRNTVTAAYLQLIEEGFLESRPRSGVFVAAHSWPAVAQADTALNSALAKRDAATRKAPDWKARQVSQLLFHPSGLLGLSGVSSDMRELQASAAPGAALAIDYFVEHVVREIAGMAAALRGIDTLVFTGGIGENATSLRSRIVAGLTWLGDIAVQVLHTNKEAVIARHTAALT